MRLVLVLSGCIALCAPGVTRGQGAMRGFGFESDGAPALATAGSASTQSAVAPAVAAYPTPADDVVNRIRREYLHHWMLVTTRSSRHELKSNDIGHEGLGRLEPRRRSDPVPQQIPWSDIERIDVRRRHTLQGALWGAAGGAVGGALLPTLKWAGDPEEAGKYAYAGMYIGAVLGAWIGRWHRTDHAVYVAPETPPDHVAVALEPPGSSTDSTSVRTPGDAAESRSAPPSREVERACGSMSTDDLLRIEGSFGRFVGHASTIAPSGFEGLHDEASTRSVRSLHSLDWEQIERVEVQRNGAFRGAVRGALITTTITVLATGIAIAAEGGIPTGEGPYLYQFVAYIGVLSIPVGTTIGAISGAVSPYWKQVYRRP